MIVDINSQEVFDAFCYDGFYSEYLPPSFSIKNGIDAFSIDIEKKKDYVEPLAFSMSRFAENGKRRTIYVPEFVSYVAAIKYIKENDMLIDLLNLSKDEHSFSPLIQGKGELVRHERDYGTIETSYAVDVSTDLIAQEETKSTYIPNIAKKLIMAKGAKGILYLDIANFYPSIYTHIIPSIKLGYEEAEKQYKLAINKKSPSDDYKKYADLDKMIRGMNGNRTNGLLPGTLLAQFVAEALLAQIDKEIEECGISFTRYVDDYEVFIFDEQDIPKVQNQISSVFGKYFLSLNNEKTKYVAFPYYVVDNLEKIYASSTERKLETPELIQLFNSFYELEKRGTKGAVRYLIKSIDDSFEYSNGELLSAYLLDVLVNDNRSLVKVCELIIQQREKLTLGEKELHLIDRLITKNVKHKNDLEAIWLLYLRKKVFSAKIQETLVKDVAESDNELLKIVLFEEYKEELSETIVEIIRKSAKTWLLAYQLYYNDVIDRDKFSSIAHIEKNLAYYKQLKSKKFSFYQKE